MKNTESHATTGVVTDQHEQPASKQTPSKKRVGQSKSKVSVKAKKTAKAKTTAAKVKTTKVLKQAAKAVQTQGPRAENKGGRTLALIARGKGAMLAEIMETTAWQAHSVRSFLSIATKKHGIQIGSAKNDKGERVYRVSK